MNEFDQVHPNGLYMSIVSNGILISGSPHEEPPFEVEAVVIEQDRFLVMTPPQSIIVRPQERMDQLITAALNIRPYDIGTVLIQDTHPLTLLAVIHDLDNEPSWHDQGIIKTLTAIISVCEQRSLHALAVPLFGTKPALFHTLSLVQQVISTTDHHCLERIWLVTTPRPPVSCFTLIDP